MMTNQEIVEKATITADALAAGGKLNPAQSDRFIDFVVDETTLRNNARIVRFRNETLEIDKIGVGRRLAVPKSEGVDPQVRRGVTTSKVTLTPKEVMVPFEIGDTFREINIEGDNIEETIIKLFANQTANDLEDGGINGNKLGPARLQSDLVDDGDSTRYVKDTYLGLWDGWSLLADSGHVVDAGGANIGISLFGQAIRAMPTKFRRNNANLRWYLSPDLHQIYLEKLSTRATTLGDAAVQGNGVNPFGIPLAPVPLWPFNPLTVEHVTLTGTTVVNLKSSGVRNVVVVPTTINKTPIAKYIEGTDYTLDATAGTIVRIGGGAIGSGTTVKVTYDAAPQLILAPAQNMILAIGRDVRIEKDRDIHKGINQYAITTKMDVQFEELDAVVKVKNIGENT